MSVCYKGACDEKTKMSLVCVYIPLVMYAIVLVLMFNVLFKKTLARYTYTLVHVLKIEKYVRDILHSN